MFYEFLTFSAFKLLFIPAYRSTDFEVHRNWLAITRSTNLSRWYYEETSEWTLDYPPIFAYFEYALSYIAQFFDAEMLRVENLNYASDETILFQRLSVIFVDVVYFLGVRECLKSSPAKPVHSRHKFFHFILLLCNVGLLMVDHIHFQYNGMLFGLLLLSCGKMFQRKFIQSAFYFALLLNMKHIFMYMAPVYFVFLLRHYCFGNLRKFAVNVTKLGLVVLTVTAVSFGPFVQHLPQVFARLFPFKRGLTHAYWAPNFWALYNFADKIAAIVQRVPVSSTSSSSSGLVQDVEHAVLPSITPAMTFLISIVAILPCCIKALLSAEFSVKSFMKPLIICTTTSFMFGWHVHEKAILMVLIPLQVLTYHDRATARMSLFLTIFGSYSLLPLLFTVELVLVKLSLFITYVGLAVIAFKSIYDGKLLATHEKLYSICLIALPLYEHLIQYPLGLHVKMPFMPLMLTSVYCAIGMSYFWLKFYFDYMRERAVVEKMKVK